MCSSSSYFDFGRLRIAWNNPLYSFSFAVIRFLLWFPITLHYVTMLFLFYSAHTLFLSFLLKTLWQLSENLCSVIRLLCSHLFHVLPLSFGVHGGFPPINIGWNPFSQSAVDHLYYTVEEPYSFFSSPIPRRSSFFLCPKHFFLVFSICSNFYRSFLPDFSISFSPLVSWTTYILYHILSLARLLFRNSAHYQISLREITMHTKFIFFTIVTVLSQHFPIVNLKNNINNKERYS